MGHQRFQTKPPLGTREEVCQGVWYLTASWLPTATDLRPGRGLTLTKGLDADSRGLDPVGLDMRLALVAGH